MMMILFQQHHQRGGLTNSFDPPTVACGLREHRVVWPDRPAAAADGGGDAANY